MNSKSVNKSEIKKLNKKYLNIYISYLIETLRKGLKTI